MIRNALLAATAALLVSSLPVFADTASYGTTQNANMPATTFDQMQSPTAVTAWVGKDGEQLEMALGVPSYETVSANGDNVYDYVEHGVGYYTNGKPFTVRLEFEVAPNGSIVNATTIPTL